jgi:hypothetical protein
MVQEVKNLPGKPMALNSKPQYCQKKKKRFIWLTDLDAIGLKGLNDIVPDPAQVLVIISHKVGGIMLGTHTYKREQ